MQDKRIKVAIADDHPVVLCGVRKALEGAGYDVIGAVDRPSGLIRVLDGAQCDVVVTDYSMPERGAHDGWRLLSSLTVRHPHLPILVYSEFADPFLVGALSKRGIAGIVSKAEDMAHVVRAVAALAQGARYRSPAALTALSQFEAEPAMRRFMSLTRWQMEVAGLMLCGMSVVETARFLERGKSTISARRVSACRQLGFDREADMYRFAANRGLWLDRSNDTRSLCCA
jgi:two-component system, NarL family, captular synthesis response regulator RcsB